jgi:organic hydroperoxide reductase OsmC/OhrA
MKAQGTLEIDASGWKSTEVRLNPFLKIAREQDRERAGQLLEKANRSCLVARSISTKVTCDPAVKVVTEYVPSASKAQTNVAAGIGKER